MAGQRLGRDQCKDWAGLEPEVWAGKGRGPQPGSGQRLGRDLSLGRDGYWVEAEPDFWQGRRLNFGEGKAGAGA